MSGYWEFLANRILTLPIKLLGIWKSEKLDWLFFRQKTHIGFGEDVVPAMVPIYSAFIKTLCGQTTNFTKYPEQPLVRRGVVFFRDYQEFYVVEEPLYEYWCPACLEAQRMGQSPWLKELLG